MPLRRAHIQVTTSDVLEVFVGAVIRTRRPLQRLTLVTPWISYVDGGPLSRLLRRAARDDAAVVLVTRSARAGSHAAAIDAVRGCRGGSVLVNPRLHAKLYVCEEVGGPGFAVIGSANMTSHSAHMDELGVMIRPTGLTPLIPRLARTSVSQLAGRRKAGGWSRTARQRRLG